MGRFKVLLIMLKLVLCSILVRLVFGVVRLFILGGFVIEDKDFNELLIFNDWVKVMEFELF